MKLEVAGSIACGADQNLFGFCDFFPLRVTDDCGGMSLFTSGICEDGIYKNRLEIRGADKDRPWSQIGALSFQQMNMAV